VPSEAVTKTAKPVRRLLHPDALAAIERLRPAGQADGSASIFACPHDNTTLANWHKRLQRDAGLPPKRILSLHAWRRTHAEQLGLIGLDQANALASFGLDHSAVQVTTEHYSNMLAEAIKRMPRLLTPPSIRPPSTPRSNRPPTPPANRSQ
jgi:integrase